MSKILVEVIIIMLFTFPIVVEELLSDFRDQFISDMDVNMVVMELLHKKIISDSVRERIDKADGPRHRSEILHDYLKRTCNKDTFRTVCDIIGSVQGNPNMSALGNHMQRSLESGLYDHVWFYVLIVSFSMYVCICVRECACVCVYLCVCVCVCMHFLFWHL